MSTADRTTIHIYQGDEEELEGAIDWGAGVTPPTIVEAWFALAPETDPATESLKKTLTGGAVTMPDASTIRANLTEADTLALAPATYAVYAKYRTSAGAERHLGNRLRPQKITIHPSPLSNDNGES